MTRLHRNDFSSKSSIRRFTGRVALALVGASLVLLPLSFSGSIKTVEATCFTLDNDCNLANTYTIRLVTGSVPTFKMQVNLVTGVDFGLSTDVCGQGALNFVSASISGVTFQQDINSPAKLTIFAPSGTTSAFTVDTKVLAYEHYGMVGQTSNKGPHTITCDPSWNIGEDHFFIC